MIWWSIIFHACKTTYFCGSVASITCKKEAQHHNRPSEHSYIMIPFGIEEHFDRAEFIFSKLLNRWELLFWMTCFFNALLSILIFMIVYYKLILRLI